MSFCCLCLSVCVGVTQCGTCMVLRRQLPGIGSDSAPLLLEPSHWLLKIFWDILVTFKLFSYPRHQYVSDGNMACNFLSTLLPDVALPTLSSLSHCKSGRGDLGQWSCPFGCRNEGRKEYVICISSNENNENLAFISHTLQKELKMDQRLWWKTCKPETTEGKHKMIVLWIGPQRH